MAGAKFVGFDQGRLTWAAHHDEVMAEIIKLPVPAGSP
jgi:hypothetical protein